MIVNQDHLHTLLFQLSETEIPFQIDAAKSTELPLFLARSKRAIFPRGAGYHYFSFCPQHPVAEAKFFASSVKVEALFFQPSPTHGMETLP